MASISAFELEYIAPRSTALECSLIDKGTRSTAVPDSTTSSAPCRPVSPAPAIENDVNGESDRQEFSLPPVDGGKDAWLFLAACCLVEALIWGMYTLHLYL